MGAVAQTTPTVIQPTSSTILSPSILYACNFQNSDGSKGIGALASPAIYQEENLNPNNSQHNMYGFWSMTPQSAIAVNDFDINNATGQLAATPRCYWDESRRQWIGYQPMYWGRAYISGNGGQVLLGPFAKATGTLICTIDGDGNWVKLEIKSDLYPVPAFKLYPAPFLPTGSAGRWYCWASEYTPGNYDPALTKMGGYFFFNVSSIRNSPGGVLITDTIVGSNAQLPPATQPQDPTTQPSNTDFMYEITHTLGAAAGKMSNRNQDYTYGQYSLSKAIKDAWEETNSASTEQVAGSLKQFFVQTEFGRLVPIADEKVPIWFKKWNFDWSNAVNTAIDTITAPDISQHTGIVSPVSTKLMMKLLLYWWFITRALSIILYGFKVTDGEKVVDA